MSDEMAKTPSLRQTELRGMRVEETPNRSHANGAWPSTKRTAEVVDAISGADSDARPGDGQDT